MLTRIEAMSLFKFEAAWEIHCKDVAEFSEKIATNMNYPELSSEFAYIYGLVHDIGRITERGKAVPKSHPEEGYKFLKERGYPVEAMSCLTHTFPSLQDITLVPGLCHPDWKENEHLDFSKYDEFERFIMNELRDYKPTIYDKIVHISDLTNGGLVTIEERLADVYSRFGDKPNRKRVYEAILDVKKEVENYLPCTVEDLMV